MALKEKEKAYTWDIQQLGHQIMINHRKITETQLVLFYDQYK